MPRCLMYEIYVETCGQNAQNQVNPAMFGKVCCEDKNTVSTEWKSMQVINNWWGNAGIYLGLSGYNRLHPGNQPDG